MPMSSAFQNLILNHLFLNSDVANVGDATGLRGSTTVGSLYVAGHTASPGAGGSQSTNEIAFTGYVRRDVPRTAPGFTVTGNVLTFTADVSLGACTTGSGTITDVSIGLASSGAGVVAVYGTLTPTIAVSAGVTPIITTGSTVTLT
jgi:hypothetical protein